MYSQERVRVEEVSREGASNVNSTYFTCFVRAFGLVVVSF